jgi:bifunctional non-homologous end joining protein LigD
MCSRGRAAAGPATKAPPTNDVPELAQLLRESSPGIAVNEHYVGHGEIVYQQACGLGCEGIVSKRLGSAYSGRSKHWLKVKNPKAPAVRREAEEEWR